jgi:hypothetical protein
MGSKKSFPQKPQVHEPSNNPRSGRKTRFSFLTRGVGEKKFFPQESQVHEPSNNPRSGRKTRLGLILLFGKNK